MVKTTEQVIDEIKTESLKIDNNLKFGSIRVANASSKKMIKLKNYILENLDLCREIIDALIYEHDPRIRCYIASIALDANYRIYEAEKILVNISEAKLGAVSMESFMILNKFRK